MAKTTRKKSSKESQMTLGKYFKLKDPPVHIYTRAYLLSIYRGIIKSENEWEDVVKENISKGE